MSQNAVCRSSMPPPRSSPSADSRPTSVDDVIKGAKLSGKSHFYHYFKSKEELGYEVLNRQFERFAERGLAILREPMIDPLERLNLFIDARRGVAGRKRWPARVAVRQSRRRDGGRARRVPRAHRGGVRALGQPDPLAAVGGAAAVAGRRGCGAAVAVHHRGTRGGGADDAREARHVGARGHRDRSQAVHRDARARDGRDVPVGSSRGVE